MAQTLSIPKLLASYDNCKKMLKYETYRHMLNFVKITKGLIPRFKKAKLMLSMDLTYLIEFSYRTTKGSL